MIVYGSQRGNGQDLATHLQNAEDNEYVEVVELRGSVADDLHGFFAEIEAQAAAMTNCSNYLYSLSENADPAQGPMPRELYLEYANRAEEALGLSGQARAIVCHIKEDRNGVGREHYHVAWSRIDVQEMKAIPIAFDRYKLMAVTRQFARDYDIKLAPGYHRHEDRKRQTHRQDSLYDRMQENTTGLSREERTSVVTELWRGRDSPSSFVQALEHHGYILANGKRPYVLVDVYGHTNALPKLIDDKAANTKAIREFLSEEFPPDSLPSVDEAKELAAQHRKAEAEFQKEDNRAEQSEQLREHQARRREKLDADIAAKLDHHKQVRLRLEADQLADRSTLRAGYLQETEAVRHTRAENKPRGLAGFLARVSGVEEVRRRLHRHQDKNRYDAFLTEKMSLQERQAADRADLQRRHDMQALDLERKRRALDQIEKRERRSLEMSLQKQRHIRARAGHEHMPSVQLALTPRGRPAAPHKAMNRYTSEVGRELRRAAQGQPPQRKPDDALQDQFARAAGAEPEQDRSQDGGTGRQSTPDSQPARPAREFRQKSRDRDGGRKR